MSHSDIQEIEDSSYDSSDPEQKFISGLKKELENDDNCSDGYNGDFDDKSKFFIWINQVLIVTFYIVILLSTIILGFCLVVSFYSVIIINFVFFVSTTVSYVLSPVFHGLSQDWLQYIFSIFQIILANPLIEFFIYFIIMTVKYFGESTMKFSSLIKFFVLFFISNAIEDFVWVKTDFYNPKLNLLKLFASFIFLALTSWLKYVTFVQKNWMIFLGMIPYILIVLQILILMIPAYCYWIRCLFGIKSTKLDSIERNIQNWIDWVENELLSSNNYGQKDVEVQTIIPSFNEPLISHLDISDNENTYKHKKKKDKQKKKIDQQKNIALSKAQETLLPLVFATRYLPLLDYAIQIGRDTASKKLKQGFILFFTILNLAVIIYDIYRLVGDFSPFFLASIILRIIFFPLIAYFHLLTAFMYKAKSKLLHIINVISTIFSFIVLLACVLCLIYVYHYSDVVRINNLDYIRNNTVLDKMVFNEACFYNYENLSLIDAYGLALGPYDVNRNYTIFDNQMKYFFGENWEQNIQYEVHYINKQTPFIIYTINNSLVVYGFRGFSSGSELALQIEMFAIQYVVPFFQDIVPLYSVFVDYFIDLYAKFAHNFGNQFFDPVSMSTVFIHPIEDIYNSKNYPENTKIVFTGINIGGLFSKTIGMITKKQGISFISFPSFNDYFLHSFDFSDDDAMYITNVYNYNGFWALQEPEVASNIGIPWVENSELIRSDSVYRTFCTIAEMCGKGPRFSHFCSTVVDDYNDIVEYFQHHFNYNA